MNLLFHKMRTGKKGQIFAVLTLALIIFSIAAFLVVNLGKNNIQDSRIKYASRSGVLAGGSAACTLLNSMANLNDNMVLNFVGFTLMMQFLLISWIVDYVKAVIALVREVTPYNWDSGPKLLMATWTMSITTATIALQVCGATKTGNSIKKFIDELNEKLPKNSRDSARQYAFSNAGVDQPKIPFSKSGCADAWEYSNLETTFDVFMRTLPNTNRGDTNYGTSTLEFDWNDLRNAVESPTIVNNKISVMVTPVAKVGYTLYRLSDVGSKSGLIQSYLSTRDLGWLKPLILFGVGITTALLVLIVTSEVLMIAFAVVITIVAVVLWVLSAVYWGICLGCSWFFCACCWACPLAAYYDYAALWATAAAAVALIAAGVITKAYSDYPPSDIPCFVWDEGSNKYPISVQVTRTTSPSSINYGIYQTDWPTKTQGASGEIRDGALFPPSQSFDIYPVGF